MTDEISEEFPEWDLDDIDVLQKQLEDAGIRVLTDEEEAELGLDLSTIPAFWQWRYVIFDDGSIELAEVYFNEDSDPVGYVFSEQDEHADAYIAALKLRVLHVDQLPVIE